MNVALASMGPASLGSHENAIHLEDAKGGADRGHVHGERRNCGSSAAKLDKASLGRKGKRSCNALKGVESPAVSNCRSFALTLFLLPLYRRPSRKELASTSLPKQYSEPRGNHLHPHIF